MRIKFFSILLLVLVPALSNAFTEIVNPKELSDRLGLKNLVRSSRDLSQIKIAVLDNCFSGYRSGVGMLPDSAEFIDGPLSTASTCSHGLGMAQILWAVTGQKKEGPKIYMINSNGYTNFKAAVDFVVNNNVDIVLYSQVWLFGSNFDGKGFINEVVNKATNHGAIWINAAGNLGAHVHQSIVGIKDKVEFENKLDDNGFTVTLTWNDFSDTVTTCSTKDLDLQILDSQNRVVKTADLIQQGRSPDINDSTDRNSCYARETLTLSGLERGTYYAKIINKSGNFTSTDKFRMIITDDRPGSLDFKDRSIGHEIMPPADNAHVITVGEKSLTSASGPTSDGRIKPDVLIENSKVTFTNGNQTSGTSNAAAMFAGAVVLLKEVNSSLTWQKLLGYTRSLSEKYLIPVGHVVNNLAPTALKPYVPQDGVIAVHNRTNRYVILSKQSPVDLPILKPFNLQIVEKSDIVACSFSLTYCAVYEKSQDHLIRPPMIEFRQLDRTSTMDQLIWSVPRDGRIN